MSKLSQKPKAQQNRRRRLLPLVGAATVGTALLLAPTSEKGPEGTCIVPISSELAREGIGGLADELDVSGADIKVTDSNGNEVNVGNREMTKDLSGLFQEDAAVVELNRDDIATADHVGKAACEAIVEATFRPRQ